MTTNITDDTLPAGIIRAYSYVRMSTHKQLRGDSLRRQLERSRAFAAEHGLILDESLRDIGISAWKGKNLKGGALGMFLKMVDEGCVARGSYLLIESLDRLSREAVPDALTLFMEIINAGITIVTLGEDRQVYSHASLKGDWTKLIIGLAVMSRGHEESQTKSERISAANKRKRDEARSGHAQITGRTPAWIDAERIDRDRYTFSLNGHAATVKTIFEMAARGLGSTAIARILNADGVPAFKSRDGWYQSIIKSLLRRTDVIGTFQPHRIVDGKRVPDGDPIEDYFPAAIDKDLFLQVQAMRPLTAHAGRRGKTFANLFTGLCSCSHCGGPMSLKMSRLKDGLTGYLVCSNHARGHRCEDGRKNFRYDVLERAVLDHVEVLNLADILQARYAGTIGKETDERIASLTLLSEDLHRRERRLALALENEAEPIDTIINLIKSRRAERTEVEAELQALKVERAAMERRALSTPDADHIGELRRAWENAATDEERYQFRAEAHAAVREFVTCLDFDSIDNTATLIIANGILAYRFKDAELLGHFDACAIFADKRRQAA